MSKEYKKSKIMLMAAIAFLFSGIHSFADMGKGYGHQHGMHQGQGWHHRGSGGPGCSATNARMEGGIQRMGTHPAHARRCDSWARRPPSRAQLQ